MASQLSNLLNWAAKRVTDVSSQPSGSNEIDSDWVMEDTEGLNMPGSQPKVTTNTSFSYQRKEASKSKSSVSGLPTPTSSIRYPPFTPEPRSPVPSSPLGAYDHLPKTPNNPSSPSPAFPLSPQSPEIEDVSTCPDHVSIAGDFPCNAGIGSVDCASSGDESNGDWSMISNHDSGAEDMPSEPDLLPKQPVSQASEDSQADRPSSVPSLANLSKNESDSRRKFEVIAGSKTPLHRPKKRRKLLAHTAGRVTPKSKTGLIYDPITRCWRPSNPANQDTNKAPQLATPQTYEMLKLQFEVGDNSTLFDPPTKVSESPADNPNTNPVWVEPSSSPEPGEEPTYLSGDSSQETGGSKLKSKTKYEEFVVLQQGPSIFSTQSNRK